MTVATTSIVPEKRTRSAWLSETGLALAANPAPSGAYQTQREKAEPDPSHITSRRCQGARQYPPDPLPAERRLVYHSPVLRRAQDLVVRRQRERRDSSYGRDLQRSLPLSRPGANHNPAGANRQQQEGILVEALYSQNGAERRPDDLQAARLHTDFQINPEAASRKTIPRP